MGDGLALSQQVPGPEKEHAPDAPRMPIARAVRPPFVPFLAFVTVLLLVFLVAFVGSLPAALTPMNTPLANMPTWPLQAPGNQTLSPLSLAGTQEILYTEQDGIYIARATDSTTNPSAPRQLDTPGYIYNRALPPRLTSRGEILYSGDGLWLFDIASGQSRQIASLPQDQVITSVVLSDDGSMLAWSSAPKVGPGTIKVYAGSLEQTSVVYQQSASACPCMRAFAFLHGDGAQAHRQLLLTNSRGDPRAVRFGLWSLDLDDAAAGPQQLLPGNGLQGPLALAESGNMLLYSSYEGFVPAPVDGSAPSDISSLSYANSLLLTTIAAAPLQLRKAQTLLPEQGELSNSASYHWVATPRFTLDGQKLVYIEFSSDAHYPFARHSALYSVQIHGSGAQLQAQKPQLLTTASARYVELGGWLNDHILTFYADHALYALDIQQGAIAHMVSTDAYAHIFATMPVRQA